MLTAEDIPVPRAATRDCSLDRELDREGRIKFHVISQALRANSKQPADRGARESPTAPNTVVSLPVRKDNIEGNTVNSGILAPDRLGQIEQPDGLHRSQTPASSSPLLNNAIGSSIRIV